VLGIVLAGAVVIPGGPAAAQNGSRLVTPDIPRRLPDGYAVLPFENASGVKGLEWMRVALPIALAEKLEAHPGLRLMSAGDLIVPEGVAPAFVDEAVVVAAAEKLGARFVWTGTFKRPDWKLELFVRLWLVDEGTATASSTRRARRSAPGPSGRRPRRRARASSGSRPRTSTPSPSTGAVSATWSV
jgi:hypothetical protein